LGDVNENPKEEIIKNNNKEEINGKESHPNDIIEKLNNNLIKFNGKDFRNYQKVNKYNNKRKIKKTIYKCKNYRKNEKLRIETNQKPFCDATLEYIERGQNVKSGYFLKKDHSLECELFEGKEKEQCKNEIKISETKEDYINKCENIMNTSNIYDRHLFKESFKKLYNQKDSIYKFPLNDNFLSNIISNWKRKSVRFKKEGVLYDDKDFQNRQLLREFRIIPILEENNKKKSNYEYIIWGNSENIMRLRVSKNIFIDCTYHHPPGFYQLLIIMYKDIITELKIPALYILLNSKNEQMYDLVFESIINIIIKKNIDELNYETIVTDQEIALINVIKKYFPNSHRIACLFHYKQDILRNLKTYGLYKKKFKETSITLLEELGKIPFYYKGDINTFNEECKKLIENYPQYTNFINNYFIKNKKQCFIDQSLNYHLVPSDCRTNSFLENYNGYIKSKLGKHRLINWVNFLNFLKEESQRSINKLYNATGEKLKNLPFEEQLFRKNPFIKISEKQVNNIKIVESENKNKMDKSINTNNLSIYEKNEKIYKSVKAIINSRIGFNNLGQTCYINSSIQILLHYEKLLVGVLKHKNPSTTKIANVFIDLAENLIKIDKAENDLYIIKAYTPIVFIKEFFKLHPTFKEQQQDAMEFIRIFLDDISKETNRNKNIPKYKELDLGDKAKNIQSKEYDEYFLSRENSIITDLFYTQIINIFTCHCGKETYSFQKLIDIPLLIPNDKKTIDIYSLLEKFLSEIKVNINEKCNNCNKLKNNIKKRMKFSIVNDIIMFSFQRFDPLLSIKNNCKIIFEENINLKRFSDEIINDKDLNYKLYATIHHIGTLEYGHYYSQINLNGQWINFNDSNVTEVENREYSSSNVSVLIYKKTK